VRRRGPRGQLAGGSLAFGLELGVRAQVRPALRVGLS